MLVQTHQSPMANLSSESPPREHRNGSAGLRSPQQAQSLPPEVRTWGRGATKFPQRGAGSLVPAVADGLSRPPHSADAKSLRGRRPLGLTQLWLQLQVLPGPRAWPQAAGGVSQAGARNILLQQGDPCGGDFVCHGPATSEPHGPTLQSRHRGSAVPRTPRRCTPTRTNKSLVVTACSLSPATGLPLSTAGRAGSCQASPRVHASRWAQLRAAADIGGITTASSSGGGRAEEPSAVPVPAPPVPVRPGHWDGAT